ncbi:MAG: Eco57I restriction-modification methylase domain-containing protein [Promethearchaeota archaeon]
MVSNKSNYHNNQSIGQIFTPDYVAEFMVRNIVALLAKSNTHLKNLKILEPSVGEGIFLKYLLQHEFSNIHAFEMDTSLKQILLNLYPAVNFKFENFLGSNEKDKYDLIIGNPPYLGQNYNAAVFQDYMKKYPICAKYFVGNMDLFYYFIHIGIEKLNPGGLLSFITTNYWITKSQKTGIKLLKPHILNECFLLQYIDLSNLKVFDDARGQHNCIFVLQKKTNQEKINNTNRDIKIIQILGNHRHAQNQDSFNNLVFKELIHKGDSSYKRSYVSAITNKDLKHNGNWNLLYPREIKSIVDKIENYCKINDRILNLNNFFIIRNGLILINDDIFILKEGKELKIEKNQYYIQINGMYFKLNTNERKRLKKIYKSRAIIPYGYNKEDYIGYLIYFNKSEFSDQSAKERYQFLEKKYPNLTKYLQQFKGRLSKTLINAKENPHDFYYPRRGSFIRKLERDSHEILVDLESSYESGQKIFLKFISNENHFGYTTDPYYATSDTYFLWPKLNEKSINYPFIVAYLNSNIVSFLFRAKNIFIKRSKTKLEYGLPIPNLDFFSTKKKSIIINLIEELALFIMEKVSSISIVKIDELFNELLKFSQKISVNYNLIKDNVPKKLNINNKESIQKIINFLFIQLFDLDVKNFSRLLKDYYHMPLN